MRRVLPSSMLVFALWIGSKVEQSVTSWTSANSSSRWRRRVDSERDLWTSSGLVRDLELPDTMLLQLEVKYGDLSVVMNGTLTPAQTAKAPTMVRLKGGIDCLPPFGLIMLDPDAPSRKNPVERSWLLWMVVNIRSTTKLHEGTTVKEYRGPAPARGSGPHRYVFLAYCPNFFLRWSRKTAPKSRKSFNLAEFTRKWKAGSPFGGTFFYAENA